MALIPAAPVDSAQESIVIVSGVKVTFDNRLIRNRQYGLSWATPADFRDSGFTTPPGFTYLDTRQLRRAIDLGYTGVADITVEARMRVSKDGVLQSPDVVTLVLQSFEFRLVGEAEMLTGYQVTCTKSIDDEGDAYYSVTSTPRATKRGADALGVADFQFLSFTINGPRDDTSWDRFNGDVYVTLTLRRPVPPV